MDTIQPINTVSLEPIESLTALERLQHASTQHNVANAPPTPPEKQKAEAAKEFESVLLTQLLNEMKNTIGQWGSEKDGAAQQVDSMFWSYLGQDMGQQGGLGLWKQIAHDLSGNGPSASTPQTLEETA